MYECTLLTVPLLAEPPASTTCHRCAVMYRDPDEIYYSKTVVWVLSLHPCISVYHYCISTQWLSATTVCTRMHRAVSSTIPNSLSTSGHSALRPAEGQSTLTKTSARQTCFFTFWNQRTQPFLMTAPAEKPLLHTTNDNYRGTCESVRETHWANYPELTLPQRKTTTAHTSRTECVQ